VSDSAYYVAWQMTQNMDLTMRVAASAQQESEAATTPIEDPEAWARANRWDWATQSDWIAAVSAAMDTGITAWGSNAGVITDQYILSYVQSAIA
jgi:hypothetical protein